MTRSGAVIAAWLQGRPRSLYAAQRGAAGGWSVPVKVADEVTGRTFDLGVGVNGGASLVWGRVGSDPTFTVLRESHLMGEDWTTPVRIGLGNRPYRFVTPQVVVDGRQTVTVAYSRETRLWARTRPVSSGRWGQRHRLTGANNHGFALATNSRGRVVVAWPDGTVRAVGLRVAFRSAAGRWGRPRTIPRSVFRGYSGTAQIVAAVARDGRALVVASQWRDDELAYWARSTRSGGWSRIRLLTRQPTDFTYDLSLTLRGTRDALVSWGYELGKTYVATARFHAGRWAVRSSHGFTDPGRSRSWMDQDGTAYLIALDYDEDTDTQDLWMKTQALGARWSAPTNLTALFGHTELVYVTGHGHRMIMLWRSAGGLMSAVYDAGAP